MGTYYVPLQSRYMTYLPYVGLKTEKQTKKKAGFSKKSWVLKKGWVFLNKLFFFFFKKSWVFQKQAGFSKKNWVLKKMGFTEKLRFKCKSIGFSKEKSKCHCRYSWI